MVVIQRRHVAPETYFAICTQQSTGTAPVTPGTAHRRKPYCRQEGGMLFSRRYKKSVGLSTCVDLGYRDAPYDGLWAAPRALWGNLGVNEYFETQAIRYNGNYGTRGRLQLVSRKCRDSGSYSTSFRSGGKNWQKKRSFV